MAPDHKSATLSDDAAAYAEGIEEAERSLAAEAEQEETVPEGGEPAAPRVDEETLLMVASDRVSAK